MHMFAFVATLCVPGALALRMNRQEAETPHEVVHRELFTVQVNFDIEEFEPSSGVTMVFAKGSHNLRLDPGISPTDGLAWGRFDDNIDSSGWSELYMETSASESSPNEAKVYAAGYAEGLMTCVRISEYYSNNFKLLLKREEATHSMAAIKTLFEKELAYMRHKTNLESHVLTDEPSDPYWKQIRLVMTQMWGVTDGYNYAARHFGVHPFSLEDLVLLNSGAELSQLMEAYSNPAAPTAASFLQMFSSNSSMSDLVQRAVGAVTPSLRGSAPAKSEDPLDDVHWEQRLIADGHCSAFVHVATGNDDILVGHTTWDDYSKMTRIFKYYKFPFSGADTVAKHIAFSSYPGAISSGDDFYITDSGLAVTETSLEVLNPTAWNNMQSFVDKPRIPTFAHVMAVNRLARSAPHWAHLYTSGAATSYAAQWLVVDYNVFKQGEEVKPNTLWVVETLAGLSHSEDMSEKLRTDNYFPSFNRPYFADMRDVSGHAAAEATSGRKDLYSYTLNPRALIFKEASGGTNMLYEMRGLMSRNLLPGRPGHDISARMDLAWEFTPLPNGGIDSKITSRCLLKRMEVQAQSGPSHNGQPAFEWVNSTTGKDTWPDWPHVGQPSIWNFGFTQMSPLGTVALTESGSC